MKVKQKNWSGENVWPLSKFIKSSITDTETQGVAEKSAEDAKRSATMIGILVNILAEKGILNVADVAKLTGEDESELSFISE